MNQLTHRADSTREITQEQSAPIFENQPVSLLNAVELARWLGCTEKHVRNLVFRREIPFKKVGRLVRFDVVEIRGWLQKRSHL
jgi:excisionase family DNA binding protein